MSLSVRSRRVIACTCIAASLACLILAGSSIGVTAAAIVSIAGSVLYLRSTGGRPVSLRMSRVDRAAWASARTLADLGGLTARWIEGKIASQPGYCGPSDIEDPAMVPVLARLNRAGFVTTGSQAASGGTGFDGGHWQQRAAVEGFAGPEMAARLISAAVDAGLIVIAHDPADLPRWRLRHRMAVPVTTRDGQMVTGFGCHLSRLHLRDPWVGYGICGDEALDALCGAWQVTVADPVWGRRDVLWRVLGRASSSAGGTS